MLLLQCLHNCYLYKTNQFGYDWDSSDFVKTATYHYNATSQLRCAYNWHNAFFVKVYYEDAIEHFAYECDKATIAAQVTYTHYHQPSPTSFIPWTQFKGYVLPHDIRSSGEMTDGHRYREKALRVVLNETGFRKIGPELDYISSFVSFHFAKYISRIHFQAVQ